MNSLLRLGKQINRIKITNLKLSNFSNSFKEKETAEEKLFIDKNERELMKKLLNKLNAPNEPEPEGNAHTNRLKEILKKHNTTLNSELFNDLLNWKNGNL